MSATQRVAVVALILAIGLAGVQPAVGGRRSMHQVQRDRGPGRQRFYLPGLPDDGGARPTGRTISPLGCTPMQPARSG